MSAPNIAKTEIMSIDARHSRITRHWVNQTEMAISVWFTQWRVIREWRASILMISVLAILGALIVMSTGSRLYLDACAVLSVSGVAYACSSQSFRLGVISAVIMLVGLLCFAAKISPVTALQPADILHLALAAGWLGLSRRLVKD